MTTGVTGIFNATTSTCNTSGFTDDDIRRVVEKMNAFMAETNRLDVELFKAVLRSGITIVPRIDLHCRQMILSVPESMSKLVAQAKNELVNPAVAREEETEAMP